MIQALQSGTARVLKGFSTAKESIERLDAERKLIRYKVREFEPNVSFSITCGRYGVRTADSGADLEACLKLRFEVFHREYKDSRRAIGVDVDRLDFLCDHLMIVDEREGGRVVGTYRLNSSRFNDVFYSASEFTIDPILNLPGNKLELGRACIDREYRTGVVIALLWRGIAEYIRLTETKVLFGCASVKTMEPLEIGLIAHQLSKAGATAHDLDVKPTRKFKVRQFERVMEYLSRESEQPSGNVKLPALFNSYLKAGAKVIAEPAIDREYACIDFLTILKMEDMKEGMKSRYDL